MSAAFSSLKTAILASQSVEVEVNQRHLIDKILARYSAEFTIYREVLQNANDAGASVVSIDLQTDGDGRAKSMSLQNNGRIFDDADWHRLRSIAEGNPDENKIGFFGVGFYSLFSISEEPLVVSGPTAMVFYWIGDQLYTRSSPSNSDGGLTAIYLDVRDPCALPNLDDFSEFVGKSLIFTSCLQEVSISVDGVTQVRVSKGSRENPEKAFATFGSISPHFGDLFTLPQSYRSTSVSLEFTKQYKSAKKSVGLFNRFLRTISGEAQMEDTFRRPGTWEAQYTVVTCCIAAAPSQSFKKAFERVTKKSPKSSISVSILIPEQVAEGSAKLHPILARVLPNGSQGKLYIGFETHQTSSGCFHVNAPFVPTIERESLDLVDPTLKAWNCGILSSIGAILRLLFDDMAQGKGCGSSIEQLIRVFGFNVSTPSEIPGDLACDAFFRSPTLSIMLPTTVGMRAAKDLRRVPREMASFLKSTPQVLESIKDSSFMENLYHYVDITEANIEDLLRELEAGRILAIPEITDAMLWVAASRSRITSVLMDRLKAALLVPAGNQEQYRPLREVAFFPSDITGSFPHLPLACLAPSLSAKLRPGVLDGLFGLRELSIVAWVKGVVGSGSVDAVLAEDLLTSLSDVRRRLTANDLTAIAAVCANAKCVPTNLGMKLPALSFFENVNLIKHIPTISFANRGRINDDLLKALGVKAHLPVADILANLKEWDYQSLIGYLSEVQHDVSEQELELLAEFKIYHDCDRVPRQMSQLYLDGPVSRLLGIPRLKWKRVLLKDDHVVKFMARFGLNLVVPPAVLFASVPSYEAREQALLFEYFDENFRTANKQSYKPESMAVEFIPTVTGHWAHPLSCYSDPSVIALDFPALRQDLVQHAQALRIERRPDIDKIVGRFLTVSFTRDSAVRVFEFMASVQHELTMSHWRQVGKTRFIPVLHDEQVVWHSPGNVFFACDDADWERIVTVVDFGHSANSFLRSAGVHEKPSSIHIAQRVIQDAGGMLAILGHKKYLDLLRKLAVNQDALLHESPMTFAKLQKARFLIGYRQGKARNPPEAPSNELILGGASEIFLVDDSISLQLFDVVSAPMEPLLEAFYSQLGCEWISQAVKQTYQYFGSPKSSRQALGLQTLIRTRAPLLAHENPGKARTLIAEGALQTLQRLGVMSVDRITTSRVFRSETHVDDVSACLRDQGTLLISGELDYFDIALSLARLVYTDAKLSDSLLLSNLLSLPLESLRAKGFPVDRMNLDPAGIPVARTPDSEMLSRFKDPADTMAGTEMPDRSKDPTDSLADNEMPDRPKGPTDTMAGTNGPAGPKSLRTGKHHSWLDKMKSVMNPKPERTEPKPAPPQDLDRLLRETAVRSKPMHYDEFKCATKPEEPPRPPEISNVDYCYVPDADFVRISYAGTLKVFVDTASLADSDAWLSSNKQALQAFAQLLVQLGEIYGLNAEQLSIFYVKQSSVIAFNRDQSLFFGFDFYQQQLSARTPMATIYASWYVTMAHELAHNFVGPHDQHHEFFMSSYITKHMSAYIRCAPQ